MSFACSYCGLGASTVPPFSCSYGCYTLAALKGKGRILPAIRLLVGLSSCAVLVLLTSGLYFQGGQKESIFLIVLAVTGFLLIGLPLVPYLFSYPKGTFWREPEFYFFCAAFVQLVFCSLPLSGSSVIPYQLTGLILLLTFPLGLARAWSRKQATVGLNEFTFLLAQRGRVLVKNQEVDKAISDLKEGDQVLVHPGERIPFDGVILSGTTSVDESAFTVEKTVLLKGRGDRVVGSSLNRDGDIVVKMTTPSDGHFLRVVLRKIHQTLKDIPMSYKGPQWGLLGLLTLSVVLVASWILGSRRPEVVTALSSISTLLVMAGFLLSTDISFNTLAVAMGWAIRNGILVLQAALWRKAAKMRLIFFDKTGTLTKGEYFFSQLLLERGVNQGYFLSTIFSLEEKSGHALARAVTTHPWYHEIPRHEVCDFQTHVGLGICGTLKERGGRPRFSAVGNQRFIKRFQMRISRDLRQTLEDLESMGDTVILCGWEGQVRGLMSFADSLRPDLNPLLKRLMALKIEPLMITGDHDEMMTHLSYVHGLKQVYTRCLTEEKKQKILMRQKKGDLVGMVGNAQEEDAVYTQADVGILIGAGSSVPEKKAGIVFFGSQLSRVASFISYTRKVARTILVGQVAISILLVLAVASILWSLMSPQQIIFLMMLLTVLLMLFPLRLRRLPVTP